MNISAVLSYLDAKMIRVNVIEENTEQILRKKGLWEDSDAWTEEVMHDLAVLAPMCSFEQILFSVEKMAPDRMVSLMNAYALTVTNREHVQDALEYAVQFQQTNLLERLLFVRQYDDAFKEWVLVYRLLLQILQRKLSCEDVRKVCNELTKQVQEPILQTRLALTNILASFYQGYIDEVLLFVEQLPHLFVHVKSGFIKSIIMRRISLVLAIRVIYEKGDVETGENKLLNLISKDVPDVVRASCYHALANATLLRDNDRCINYFEKAVLCAANVGLDDYYKRLLTQHLPFARNVRGEVFDVSEVIPEEKIHQYLGEYEAALTLANELENSGYNSTFLMLYRARATQDVECMMRVCWRLVRENHAYLVPFVQQEMARLQKVQESKVEREKWEAKFSARELEVLEKIYQGYSQKDAAELLCIELQTFKNHIRRILQKAGMRSSREIAVMAKKKGWV